MGELIHVHREVCNLYITQSVHHLRPLLKPLHVNLAICFYCEVFLT